MEIYRILAVCSMLILGTCVGFASKSSFDLDCRYLGLFRRSCLQPLQTSNTYLFQYIEDNL